MSRLTGKVNWFDQKKGFGIISSNDKEYFVHYSEIQTQTNNFKDLKVDEEVEFELGIDKKNRECAKKVSGVNGTLLNFETESNKPKNKPKKYKNTENFKPSHKPSEMRVVVGNPSLQKLDKDVQSRDIILVSGLFGEENDLTIYNKLLEEVNNCNKDDNLWKLWHGDSHFIADDHLDWKKDCPTFNMIIKKMQKF